MEAGSEGERQEGREGMKGKGKEGRGKRACINFLKLGPAVFGCTKTINEPSYRPLRVCVTHR